MCSGSHARIHSIDTETRSVAATKKKFKHAYSVAPWVATTSKTYGVIQQAAGVVAKQIENRLNLLLSR